MIDEIVNYCDTQYQLKNGKCVGCKITCNSNCFQCLKDIHFKSQCHRSYDCKYMCYHYICQDIHRYATEMAWMWHFLFKEIKWDTNCAMNICSIGCGPCTELVAFEEYCNRNKIQIPFTYRGFDLEKNWTELQKVARQYAFHPNNVFFEHIDVFDYYENNDKPNVIVLNYLLSNILKNSPKYIDEFVDKLCELFKSLPYGILLINDINYYTVRDNYIEKIRKNCIKNNNNAFKYHFANTTKDFYPYGKQLSKNNLLFDVPDDIISRYNTSTECHSAQLIVTKK